jgi:hypothetical protein
MDDTGGYYRGTKLKNKIKNDGLSYRNQHEHREPKRTGKKRITGGSERHEEYDNV